MSTRIVKTACQGCHPECGLLVHVENDRVVQIQGDPDHPTTRGYSCIKGRLQGELLYHDDRVTHPLKQVGPKGSGRWERVSWDDALDDIASRLTSVKEQYGAESIGAFHGTGPRASLYAARLFAAAVGTPNTISTDLHICAAPSIIAETATYGQSVMMDRGPDYRSSRCILVVGGNPVVSHPPRGVDILSAMKENDASLIVVDPRRTHLAAKADMWLRVRPGADVALVMAMIDTIIREDLYDHAFVERWCVGFDELAERAEQYAPEAVAELTWLEPEVIRAAARLFATSRPAAVHHRVGTEQNLSSTQANRALAILVALTGNLDVPGGNLFVQEAPGYVSSGDLYAGRDYRLPREIEAKRIGADTYPLISGPDVLLPFVHSGLALEAITSGEPYPLRALYCSGANPVLNMQNSRKVWSAFKELDLLVVLDFFMTPTAELADYVLPVTMWLERDEPCERQYMNCISVRQKAVAPRDECRQDLDIAADLVRRLPWADSKYLPWRDLDELNDFRLAGLGLTFDDLRREAYITTEHVYRKFETNGFKTPSGKVELYASLFAKHDLDPLPGLYGPVHEVEENIGPSDDYPLVLLTGARSMEYYHSLGQQAPALRRRRPNPEIEIHRDTAKNLGIADGDWVWVETVLMVGERVTLRARLVDDLDSRVVSATHAWWYPERDSPDHGCFDSNVSTLLVDGPRREAVCGSVTLRGVPCRVSRNAAHGIEAFPGPVHAEATVG